MTYLLDLFALRIFFVAAESFPCMAQQTTGKTRTFNVNVNTTINSNIC